MSDTGNRYNNVFFLAIMLMLLVISLVCFGIPINSTQAYFSDSAIVGGNSLTTGNYDPLVLEAGKSKATYVNQPGPFHTIAQVLNGQFYLDFGEVAAGNGNNSPDVFMIKNSDSVSLDVSFELSPNIAPYFEYVRLKDGGATIASGQTRSVEMKLITAQNTPTGTYSGTLRIKSGPGKIDKLVPVYFVVCKPALPIPKLATPPVVSPAEPALSEEASQSLSAEPQASPSISPNPGAPESDPASGASDPPPTGGADASLPTGAAGAPPPSG
ncbi:MAG: hypothetical protein ACYC5A_05405 [Thermoleophilia bacterium]